MSASARPAPLHGDELVGLQLFADLDDADRRRLAATAVPLEIEDGETLFEDGAASAWFYVLLSGGLLITKQVEGREEVFGRHVADPDQRPDDGKPAAAHEFTGELPLMGPGHYLARARAIGATRLACLDEEGFQGMLATWPPISRVLLRVLVWRVRSYEEHAVRRATLEGLSTFAAGLTHEMNNPLAALIRVNRQLCDLIGGVTRAAELWATRATTDERTLVVGLQERLVERLETTRDAPETAAVLAAAESTELLEEWLTDTVDGDPVDLAAMLGPTTVEDVRSLAEELRPEVVTAALDHLAHGVHLRALAVEAADSARRLTDLVASLKSYADLDRAPVRPVEITSGLEATLGLRQHALDGIQVRRHYEPELPRVEAVPAELNRVWTLLVDNALDAMASTGAGGVLGVTATAEGDTAVVEVSNSGPEIPLEHLGQIFQPFFTTKTVGQAPGLGLHVVRDIVTEHRGTIDVTSGPECTRFTVRLPGLGSAAQS